MPVLCVRFECGCDACAGGWATRDGLQDTVTRAVCPRPSCGGRQLEGEAGSSWSCGGCGHQTSAAQLSAALARPVRRTVEAAQAEAGMAAGEAVTVYRDILGELYCHATHPWKGLVMPEQLFWKAVRMSNGNKRVC